MFSLTTKGIPAQAFGKFNKDHFSKKTVLFRATEVFRFCLIVHEEKINLSLENLKHPNKQKTPRTRHFGTYTRYYRKSSTDTLLTDISPTDISSNF
jgi:hypothetical protein